MKKQASQKRGPGCGYLGLADLADSRKPAGGSHGLASGLRTDQRPRLSSQDGGSVFLARFFHRTVAFFKKARINSLRRMEATVSCGYAGST